VPGEAFPDHLMDSEPVFPAYRKDPVLSGDDDCTGSGGAAVKTELVTSPACFDPVCKKVAFGSEEVFVFDPSAPAFVPAVDNGPELAEGSLPRSPMRSQRIPGSSTKPLRGLPRSLTKPQRGFGLEVYRGFARAETSPAPAPRSRLGGQQKEG